MKKIDVEAIKKEYLIGLETLKDCKHSVAIFGSSRLKENSPYYQETVELSRLLSQKSCSIITGGGPGIMEAANRGAHKAGGESYGLCIQLPEIEPRNHFVDQDRTYNFDHFCVRKAMFLHHAECIVCMPGGYGTLDELFECLVLYQMTKLAPKPVILFSKKFWGGLYSWLQDTLIETGTIGEKDLELLHLVDSSKEVLDLVDKLLFQKL